MSTISIVCRHCGFSRDVPEEKVPDKAVQVTCPKCSQTFLFQKPPLSQAENVPPLPHPHTKPASIAASAPSTPQAPREQAAADGIAPPPPRRPAPSRQPAVFPGEAAPATKPPPLFSVILLLLAVVAAAWWLNNPAIASIPDGAHIDQKNGFAVKAPTDWFLITPENYHTIANQVGDKIPKELSRMIGKAAPGFTVSFIKIPATDTDFSPNFNLAVIDTKGKNLPPLTEGEKKKATEAVSKEFSRMLPGYRMLESKIVEVDRVDSLQITGQAELTVVTKQSTPIYSEPGAFGYRRVTGHTEAEKQTYQVKTIQTVIPGKGRAYALSFMFDDLKTPEMAKLHSEVLNSFKLLERPPRFGALVMGALNGGLFGAGLYLLGLIIGRFFHQQE